MNIDYTSAHDDKAARNCAYSLNLKVIGTIGLVLWAKNHNILDNAKDYLVRLKELGYRIDNNIFNHAIKLANE